MKFRIQVVCVTDDGAEQTHQVMEFERQASDRTRRDNSACK